MVTNGYRYKVGHFETKQAATLANNQAKSMINPASGN